MNSQQQAQSEVCIHRFMVGGRKEPEEKEGGRERGRAGERARASERDTVRRVSLGQEEKTCQKAPRSWRRNLHESHRRTIMLTRKTGRNKHAVVFSTRKHGNSCSHAERA